MSDDTNNNFDELKRLLKLKQHEVPPPGYFNHLSGDIIGRIRTGESGGPQTFVERLQETSPFLLNFLRIFETRPGVVGGFATSMCLLLLLGVVFMDHSDTAVSAGGSTPLLSAQATPDAVSDLASTVALAPSDNSGGITVSTNPVVSLQPATGLFGQQQNPLLQDASFGAGSH